MRINSPSIKVRNLTLTEDQEITIDLTKIIDTAEVTLARLRVYNHDGKLLLSFGGNRNPRTIIIDEEGNIEDFK